VHLCARKIVAQKEY